MTFQNRSNIPCVNEPQTGDIISSVGFSNGLDNTVVHTDAALSVSEQAIRITSRKSAAHKLISDERGQVLFVVELAGPVMVGPKKAGYIFNARRLGDNGQPDPNSELINIWIEYLGDADLERLHFDPKVTPIHKHGVI
jgi:hypothetical protein